MDEDVRKLREKDFWTSLVLIGGSVFMLIQTTAIPFFEARAAGVDSGKWYNSAALSPYLIFLLLLALGIALCVNAIRSGGLPDRGFARRLADAVSGRGFLSYLAIAAVLLFYIFALVPRVDFILASGLVITALTYGFHERRGRPAVIALLAVAVPSIYALVTNFPVERWATPHNDDIATLAAWGVLTAIALWETRRVNGSIPVYARVLPAVAVLVPLVLVCAMAFGFRQNVPNRTGLVFKQIEYQYYVNIRPMFQGR